jgi:hypothetical protein
MLSTACNEKSGGSPPPVQAGGDPSLTARPGPPSCPEALALDCAELREKIAALEEERGHAIARSDAAAFARLSLELNRLTELLAFHESGESDAARLADLESKYEELGRRLDADIGAAEAEGEEAPEQPVDSADPEQPATPEQPAAPAESGETQRPFLPAYVYHPLETRAVAEVMRDFGGDLYVGETPRNADGSESFEVLQAPKPWAGFWYPMQSEELFGTPASPLAKLDDLLTARGRTPGAVEAERALRIGGADTWEGLCTPWAIASIMAPEPTAATQIGDRTFDTIDQKALLTKIFERYPTRFYGVRYNGDSQTDGTIQDLRPEAFHRIFTTRLAAGKAFVIDSDPSVQVWSKPVYRVRWVVRKDPEKENAFHVVAKPWLITHRIQLSADPTGTMDRTAPTYEYRLYYDPTAVIDGKYKIIAGEWLATSIDAHPDSVIIPDDSGSHRSTNAALNDNMDVVKQIVGLP